MKAREKNVGWRIDYFITSNSIKEKIEESKIHQEIMRKRPLPNRTTNKPSHWGRFLMGYLSQMGTFK